MMVITASDGDFLAIVVVLLLLMMRQEWLMVLVLLDACVLLGFGVVRSYINYCVHILPL